jgi:hypothetical protein
MKILVEKNKEYGVNEIVSFSLNKYVKYPFQLQRCLLPGILLLQIIKAKSELCKIIFMH